MEILVQVLEGNKERVLQVKGASQESELVIINGFFKLFVGSSEPHNILVKNVFEIESEEKISQEQENENIKDVQRQQQQKKVSKKLPLLASAKSTFPIGEIARISSDKPEHWVTGIKTDNDGTKRYKCRYWCDCGNQGNHYIPLKTDTVYCHSCNKKIPVEPATFDVDDDSVPERDHHGNFFIARA